MKRNVFLGSINQYHWFIALLLCGVLLTSCGSSPSSTQTPPSGSSPASIVTATSNTSSPLPTATPTPGSAYTPPSPTPTATPTPTLTPTSTPTPTPLPTVPPNSIVPMQMDLLNSAKGCTILTTIHNGNDIVAWNLSAQVIVTSAVSPLAEIDDLSGPTALNPHENEIYGAILQSATLGHTEPAYIQVNVFQSGILVGSSKTLNPAVCH